MVMKSIAGVALVVVSVSSLACGSAAPESQVATVPATVSEESAIEISELVAQLRDMAWAQQVDAAQALIEQLDENEQWRGEFVCVLEGRSGNHTPGAVRHTMSVLCRELGPAQAARLGAQLLGRKKSELYELALTLKD